MIALALLLLATTAGAESIQFDMGGQEAGVDQGPATDVGPGVDQGPAADQGVADQGPKLDKGATADAGADGGSKPADDDDGCSMSGSQTSAFGLLPLLALMLIPLIRRRR